MKCWVQSETPYEFLVQSIQPKFRPSDREEWSTLKAGPVLFKLFRLDRTDPLSFGLKFPEISVEWIVPLNYLVEISWGMLVPVY